MLSDDGHPIARRGAIKEAPVDVAKLNPLTPAAFVAIEDRRFYRHWGIDPRGMGRAMVANLRGGGVRQGGSTITQQLAKTNFLSGDRTIKRKAQEVIIAFWLEAWLTKQEILSRYLSSVYFGDGVYGLRAAAHHYFSRDPEKLTLAQSAMLAGLVQAPSRLAPTQHLAAAQKRSQLVLAAMADTGVISPRTSARDRARATRLPQLQGPDRHLFRRLGRALCAEGVRGRLRRSEGPDDAGRDASADRGARRGQRAAIGDAQAALVAMRPDGRVVAMVGGRSYRDSPFNRVTQARRQPGSAFKLFVYLAALRAGWTPDSMIEDKPITIDGWTPVNSDRGLSRADHAARGIRAVEQCRHRTPFAERSAATMSSGQRAISGSRRRCRTSPSLALGTAGVSLLELTSAYAAVASGRYPIVARGFPEEQAPEGFSAFFRPRRRAR